MPMGTFVLYDRNQHSSHLASRIRHVRSAKRVMNFVKRLDAMDRVLRGSREGVLPVVGENYDLTLSAYLSLCPKQDGLTKRVAEAVGVSPSTLRKWATRALPVPAHIVIELTRVTQGQVTKI